MFHLLLPDRHLLAFLLLMSLPRSGSGDPIGMVGGRGLHQGEKFGVCSLLLLVPSKPNVLLQQCSQWGCHFFVRFADVWTVKEEFCVVLARHQKRPDVFCVFWAFFCYYSIDLVLVHCNTLGGECSPKLFDLVETGVFFEVFRTMPSFAYLSRHALRFL